MPEPDCFLRYHISAARRNFTLGKSDVYVFAAAASRRFKWFYGPSLQRRVVLRRSEPSKQLCRRYMGSTKCPCSFALIFAVLWTAFHTWTAFTNHWTGPDIIMLIVSFLVRFSFKFSV